MIRRREPSCTAVSWAFGTVKTVWKHPPVVSQDVFRFGATENVMAMAQPQGNSSVVLHPHGQGWTELDAWCGVPVARAPSMAPRRARMARRMERKKARTTITLTLRLGALGLAAIKIRCF